MATKIPATIITGFLGSGKTTMLRHVLQNPGNRRFALIVNEFGDVGVDGNLLKACNSDACQAEDIVELANGCICCTVADDFLPTMTALLARDPAPDHILIETSGLALPKPLIKAFAWPDVKTRVTVDGVIAVVDAAAVADGLFTSQPEALEAQRNDDPNLDHESPLEELFEEQIGAADLVILNKMDLVNDAQAQAAKEAILHEARPGVSILESTNSIVSPDVLLGVGAAAEDDLDSRKSHHDGVDEHEHDDFDTIVVPVDPVANIDSFIADLKSVLERPGIHRIKGFVTVADKPMPLVVQGVGQRLQHYFEAPSSSVTKGLGKLVIIGDHDADFQFNSNQQRAA